MKIAYITRYVPSYRNGIFNELVDIANIELTIFADLEERIGLDIRTVDNNKFNSIHASHKIIKLLNRSFYYQNQLIRLIFNNNYDAFILSALKSDLSVWMGLIIGFVLNRKIVIWGHCRKKKFIVHNVLMRCMFSLADAVIFYSEDFLNEWHFKRSLKEKVFVAPNTIKIQLTTLREISNKFLNDNVCAIFSGRLLKRKQLDLLFDAIYLLKREKILINLFIIGDGPEKNKLKEQCNNLGINYQILFIESTFNDDILSTYYKLSGFSIMPAHAGLAINQSFAFGRPVLTNDDFDEHPPEVTMIKNNYSGIFYEANNISDLILKLKMLIKNPSFCQWMGNNAKEIYQNQFSPILMASGINKAIRYAVKHT